MRIAILSQPSNFHCRKWAKALAHAGAEVFVMGYEKPEVIKGVEGIQIAPHLVKNNAVRYAYFQKSRRALAEALKQHRMDIVHPLHLTPYGSWAVKSGFRNIIPSAIGEDVFGYRPWGELTPEIRRRMFKHTRARISFSDEIKRIIIRKKIKQVIRSVPVIHADNQSLKQGLIKWFHCPEEKIEVFPYGLDEDPFHRTPEEIRACRRKLNIPEESPVIFSPRGMKPYYHADIIFRTFVRLLESHPELYVIMASAGYEMDSGILKAHERLGPIRTRFILLKERLPMEELAKVWFNTDIFVSAPVFDGYSAAVAEGRYCGCIPVVNDVEGNREIIRDGINGFIVKNFGAESLFGAVKKIIPSIREIKQQMAPLNRQWVKEHALSGPCAEKFIRLCQRVLHKD